MTSPGAEWCEVGRLRKSERPLLGSGRRMAYGGSARGSLVRRLAGGVGVGIGVRIGAHGEPRAWIRVTGGAGPGCNKVGSGNPTVKRNVQDLQKIYHYSPPNRDKLQEWPSIFAFC